MKTFEPASASGRHVLVVAPHPDDEAIGPGGSVFLLGAAGAHVTVVVLADGSGGVGGGASAEERRAECEASCQQLGVASLVQAGLPSAQLREDPRIGAEALAHSVGLETQDLLLVPWPLERHPTHRASLLAALLSGTAKRDARWLGYGAWDAVSAMEQVIEVDTTAARKAKSRAIGCHVSQNTARPLSAAILCRDMAQAAFSRITGDEPRRAVERLLDLGDLPARVSAVPHEEAPEVIGDWTAALLADHARQLWA